MAEPDESGWERYVAWRDGDAVPYSVNYSRAMVHARTRRNGRYFKRPKDRAEGVRKPPKPVTREDLAAQIAAVATSLAASLEG